MDAATAARNWIDGWLRSWPARDVEGIASMYVEGAVYSATPFRAAETARRYVERAFAEEELVQAWFGEPVVSGNRAAIEYWAVLRSDHEVTVAGTSVLRFDADGRVLEHRDYWVPADERREPPSGWGQ